MAIVERWNPFAKVRQDLFGIIDLLCVKPGITRGVQVTTMSNKSSHVEKMTAHQNLKTLLAAGWEIHLHSWRELKDGWQADLKEF